LGWEAEFSDERPLSNIYKDYLKHCQKKIVAVFEIFTIPQNYPILFYCNTGKDRTGIISALVLGMIGVGDSAIVEDYHNSQSQLEEVRKYQSFRSEAPKEAISEMLSWLKKKHGTINDYLNTIGFSNEKQQAVKKIIFDPKNYF